ncbi:hypothetical protein LXA43DRAFT_1129585 [Ganoderma leucocontextum]|nr:hypothetical protein LXA43DRAFT_1129585 [Ganoderma leucocontextum]
MTYSVLNYREADNMLAMCNAASAASTKLYKSLPSEAQPVFFELVQWHPVLASLTLQNMYIYAAINNLRAIQYYLAANNFSGLRPRGGLPYYSERYVFLSSKFLWTQKDADSQTEVTASAE